MKWIKVSLQLPAEKKKPYQVLATSKKTHSEGNYKGEGIKTVVQDWTVRLWPENFTHWTIISNIEK